MSDILKAYNWILASNTPTGTPLIWVPQRGNPNGANYNANIDPTNGELIATYQTETEDLAPPSFLLGTFAAQYVYDTTIPQMWRKVDRGVLNADTLTTARTAALTSSALSAYNGASWDRVRSYGANLDAIAVPTLGLLGNYSVKALYNGATFDRARSASAANLSAATQIAALASMPGEWSINHTPADNVQATITRAAVANARHVCRSISGNVIGLTGAAETTVLLNVRDGATGAGTILWSQRLLVIASGVTGFSLSGLNIVGSVNTAMTLEFSAAGGASTNESVALTGFTVL